MRSMGRIVLAACLAAGVTSFASAQQTTTSSETKNFEVLAVTGNDLVVRLPEGTREISVPDDFRFTVNGQQMSVHELRPGMKGSAVITTRTTMTPVTLTEIKGGTVAAVSGSSIIVRTDQGIRSFTQSEIDKRAIKILRDGKPAQLSEFRAGDRLTATIVTSQPPRVVSEQDVQATLASPVEATRQAASAVGSAVAGAARATANAVTGAVTGGWSSTVGTAGSQSASSAPARTLPSTGSLLPVTALAGLASLALGGLLTARRRRNGR